MLLEERNDVPRQVLMSPYAIGHPVAVVLTDNATSEVAFQRMQNLNVTLMLNDGEFRENLNSGCHPREGIDPNMKAALAINKADDPLRIELQRDLPNVKSLRIPDSSPGLSCGFSPCPSDFYCRSRDRRVPNGCG